MKKMIGALFCGVMIGASTLMAEGNLLKGTEFKKENGWSNWTENAAKTAGTQTTFDENKFTAEIPAEVKKSEYSVQLMNSVALEEGKTYEITFTATVTNNGDIKVVYLLSKAPWSQYASTIVNLTAGTKEYKCTLAPKKVADKYEKPMSLRFFLGNLVGNKIMIENITIAEAK